METLAPSPLLREGCAALGLDPVDVILTGGEDYALLFSVKAEGYESLAKAFHTHFGYLLQRLGVVEAEKGIRLYLNNALFPFTGKPFSHFGESTPPG